MGFLFNSVLDYAAWARVSLTLRKTAKSDKTAIPALLRKTAKRGKTAPSRPSGTRAQAARNHHFRPGIVQNRHFLQESVLLLSRYKPGIPCVTPLHSQQLCVVRDFWKRRLLDHVPAKSGPKVDLLHVQGAVFPRFFLLPRFLLLRARVVIPLSSSTRAVWTRLSSPYPRGVDQAVLPVPARGE